MSLNISTDHSTALSTTKVKKLEVRYNIINIFKKSKILLQENRCTGYVTQSDNFDKLEILQTYNRCHMA